MATMQPFKLVLANNATLTGLHNLPASNPATPHHRPLVIGLHGGGFCARYYDLSAKYTASLPSNSLQVPFVAINRPGYLDSTSFYPIPAGSSYPEQDGEWLHKYILPALWKEFGAPNGCNCIVLHCHSLGTPSAVIAAAENATETAEQRAYPLGGIIFSGFGANTLRPQDDLPVDLTHFEFPLEGKFAIMLPPGTADADAYEVFRVEGLNTPIPIAELDDMYTAWLPQWKEKWAAKIRVPVMFGVASLEGLWEGTREHVKEIADAFSGSSRVDASLIEGAPHNIEASYWSQGWYARGFGFALECASTFAAQK